MKRERQTITCIYCKLLEPASREHALARSLGGNATGFFTCELCNTRSLSRLDQAIAERSLVAMTRIVDTPAQAYEVRLGGEHFHYDDVRAIHTEINVVNGLRPVPFPQIHHRPESRELIVECGAPTEMAQLAAFVEKHVAAGTLRSIHVKYGPTHRCTTSRLVLHQTKAAFVRVRAPGEEEAFFEALAASWEKLRGAMLGKQFGERTIEGPTVELKISICLDDIFRAVAKTALNVVALRVGVEFALREEFDEIRNYILGDVRHAAVRKRNQIAVDSRFVRMVPAGAPPFLPTEGHVVAIQHAGETLTAYVTLYGTNSFVVLLGTIALQDGLFVAHEFSTDRQHNEALNVEAVYLRLIEARRRSNGGP